MTGAVLAGGRGQRMGGCSKAAVQLAGRPMLAYPSGVLAQVCELVVVVCKGDTELPPLPAGVERWEEPGCPRHPAAGIAYALERAGGPVLVCAADMPFVTVEACRAVVDQGGAAPRSAAVVAEAGGRLQPVLGLYRLSALRKLQAYGDAPLSRLVEAMDPVLVGLAPELVRSVNTREELAAAEAELVGDGPLSV